MAREWRDSRGVLIEKEDHVAYNRSGDVISGVVVHMTGSEVQISADKAWRGTGWPAISRVRNNRGILILARKGEY